MFFNLLDQGLQSKMSWIVKSLKYCIILLDKSLKTISDFQGESVKVWSYGILLTHSNLPESKLSPNIIFGHYIPTERPSKVWMDEFIGS